jgi:hypothetical protein
MAWSPVDAIIWKCLSLVDVLIVSIGWSWIVNCFCCCAQLRRVRGQEHFLRLGFREMLIVIPSVIWALSFVKYGVLAPVKVCSFVLHWCRGWSEVNSACCWVFVYYSFDMLSSGSYLLKCFWWPTPALIQSCFYREINPDLFYGDCVKLLPGSNLKFLQLGI